MYREGIEFEQTKQVLGSGNSAGDIVIVKDSKKGVEHAQKTVSCVTAVLLMCGLFCNRVDRVDDHVFS